MAYPTALNVSYNYTGFQQGQGNNAFPGTQLDNEFQNVELSIDEIIAFLQGSFTSTGIVKASALFDLPSYDELADIATAAAASAAAAAIAETNAETAETNAELAVTNAEAALASIGIATFTTRNAAAAETIPITFDSVLTSGYATVGKALSLWKRQASDPSTTDSFQDAGGVWWARAANREANIHEFGPCGESVRADDEATLDKALTRLGVTGGTLVLSPETFLVQGVSATVSKPVAVRAYGATIKRPDGGLTADFQRLILITKATAGSFSWEGGTFDQNWTNNEYPDPEDDDSAEHSASLVVTTVGSAFHSRYTKFKDIILKDRAAFDHLVAANETDAYTDYVEYDNITSDTPPLTAHRGDIIWYQRCLNVLVKNCDVHRIETEWNNIAAEDYTVRIVDCKAALFDMGFGGVLATPFVKLIVEGCDFDDMMMSGATLHARRNIIRRVSDIDIRGSAYLYDNKFSLDSRGLNCSIRTDMEDIDQVFDFRRNTFRLNDGQTQTSSEQAISFPTQFLTDTGTVKIWMVENEFLGTTPNGTESLFGRCMGITGGIAEVHGNKLRCQDIAIALSAAATVSADIRIGPNKNEAVGGAIIRPNDWDHASCLLEVWGEMDVADGTPIVVTNGSTAAYIKSSRILLGSAAPATALVGDIFRKSPPDITTGLDTRMIAKASGSSPGWHAQGNHPEVTLTDAATVAVDFARSNNFVVTLEGNRTLGAPTNVMPGQRGSIRVVQDGVGTRTLAYHANWKFAGGTDPTLSVAIGAIDMIDYYAYSATAIVGVFRAALA